MDTKTELIRTISQRLLIALLSLLALIIVTIVASKFIHGFGAATPCLSMIVGSIGGFVGLQRRLKQLSEEDLSLIANSWIYTILAPLVGGILALLLYILFLSGLLAGELFPKFVADTNATPQEGFEVIFATHGAYADYAKLIFWTFVAGYSERFVVDIISQFEGKATDKKPE
jgi:phosphate/sulfate permease